MIAEVLAFLAAVGFPVVVAGLVLLAWDRDRGRDVRRARRRARERDGRQSCHRRHRRWQVVAR